MYRAQERSVEIRVTLDSTLPDLEADVGRMRQILHNLIRNSIEALEMSDDGCINVSAGAVDFQGVKMVEIVVEDNGPGFQTGSVSQVFDPYVTTKPKGTGLGLAIVKKLVEEHAGTIDAENSEAGGAVIRIRLPINNEAREAMIALLPAIAEKRRDRA